MVHVRPATAWRPRPAPRAALGAALPALLLASALGLGLAAPAAAQGDAPAGTADGVRSYGPVRVPAFAVAQTDEGLVGVPAHVEATVLHPGTGQVYVATRPLTATDMQGSARLASRVAASIAGVPWTEHDYLIRFEGASESVGGPSAGGEMAMAIAVALHNLAVERGATPAGASGAMARAWALDPAVGGTGTINPDATIGPVGGVPEKAAAAAAAGVTTFLYPAGLEQATRAVPAGFGYRYESVDMGDHCRQLGITCRPAATLQELLAEAAGLEFPQETAPPPDTAQYGDVLAPSVRDQVDGLASRLEAIEAALAARPMATGAQQLARDEVADARARLEAARAALGQERFYLAATETFQGAIAAGRAEAVRALVERGAGAATEAVQACQAEYEQANRTAAAGPRSLNALYALGAAQTRASDAQALLAQAEAEARAARTADERYEAMATAAFCVERSRTVAWWADLADAFGAGPPVTDLEALAQDAIDQASDLVLYALAVADQASEGGGGAQAAAAGLEDARLLAAEGRGAAAIVRAIEAEATASVALQTAGGQASVPAAVLEAARDGAARAVRAARSLGAEPMLSVSLVELAASRQASDPEGALASLWQARSLALLQGEGAGQPAPVAVAERAGAGLAWGVAFAFGGVALGAAVALVALAPRRR